MSDDSTIEQIIDQVPNGVHLYRIRDALQSGHAAVMVGAGFSRNAEHGSELPTWSTLMDALLADLYPAADTRQMAANRFGGVSGMLRLAEEYAVARGRAQLDTRLHQLLPDAGVINPGPLHIKLLSLPWADVYTTNYDTLLERALDHDRRQFIPKIKRRYQVVVAAQDVPFSKSNGRPRVVKLHGSLRSGSPLILTEEDYRCYPSRFAPFMNTVQQAMLENVFCLIGFSGDDPNFLQWTGWVRDRLGEQTPPIYLITLGPIPDGQRLILERRNVFPIPIDSIGQAEARIDYANAFRKLFEFWSPPAAPRRAHWPYHYPPSPGALDSKVEDLVAWARFAKISRGQYPGWLVAPERNRERVMSRSSLGTTTLAYRKQVERLPAKFRLVLLFEVVWIINTALEEIDPQRANDIEQALEGELASGSDVDEIPTDVATNLVPSEAELAYMRGFLAIAVLRIARQQGDVEKFNRWQQRLTTPPLSEKDCEIACLALHEEVLLHVERLNREEAMRALKKLETLAEGADMYWPIRVGAIFGELGAIRRGREIVRNGLHRIREAIQAQGETLPLVSREHWAERILDAMSTAVETAEQSASARKVPTIASPERDTEQRTRSPDVTLHDLILREEVDSGKREHEVTVYRDENAQDQTEHPNLQLDLIFREIDRTSTAIEKLLVRFDSRDISQTPWKIPLNEEARVAAREFARLTEEAAYVPAVGSVSLSAQHLTSSFRVLSFWYPITECLRHLIRANSGSVYTSLEPLTRAQIARLSREHALQLYEYSIRSLDACMARSPMNWDRRDRASVQFSLELASRVLLRLDAAQADGAVQRAIGWHENDALRDNTSLHRTFADFFRRAVQLLDLCTLRKRSLDLVVLNPKPALLKRFRDWPTAIALLPYEVDGLSAEQACSKAVDVVLAQSLQSEPKDEVSKAFHLERLDWLWRNGAMSKDQKLGFAEFVWKDIPRGTLPNYVGFYRGAVLAWPSDLREDVEASFRKWLVDEPFPNLVQTTTGSDGKPLQSIGRTSESLLGNILLTGNRVVRFAWSSRDAFAVLSKLRSWWETEGRALADKYAGRPDEKFGAQIVANRLRLMAHTVQRILAPHLSKGHADRLDVSGWLAELWSAGLRLGMNLVALLFTGLAWWPERETAVMEMTSNAIRRSEDGRAVSNALNSAGFWLLHLSSASSGSRSYVSFLVELVSWQRRPHTPLALESVAELLRLGARAHFLPEAHRLAAELLNLMLELSDSEPGDDIAEFECRPGMRRAAAVCLEALGRQFVDVRDGENWQQAMTLVRSDALLDVRNCWQALVSDRVE
ncbi:SIR2 family protein [Paraburkholderia sp. CNPSo 3272]|uniref:SIR2 family NAD-dependent protein deacylase n=1 Tax=Paraburkholderia sp. CNPSo 3272 TaxID=2940931 RepID=UPI0020B84424|nr:SIR2 family protein [Paraburkholderia sp. CNPSo 3272]MCP3722603.1 SIR2 family protein [Paraburkholderia sp. CNPSo 3272]